jgi:hypothetical protein
MKFTLRPQRRRADRTGPSISLFPFLAVLICTMGALVPLLLAMTRTARLQAEAAAVAKATAEAAQHEAELKVNREDVLWCIEQLKNSRKQTEKQLAGARLDLGHLEDHSRRLRAELDRYKNTVAELENIESAGRQKQGQSEAELQQLRQQIAAARQQVEQARKEAADRPRSYAVVPYEGPNQTRRRPIYLECLADAVVLQPEGVRLSAADFEGPMGPGNPLAVALRAAREHLLAQREFDPQAGEPYPLLLVRPEGIAAYYAAREAMKLWGGDFGYELVGEDWKLAYPPPNAALADVVRQATASARVTQARLIAAAPRQYPTRSQARGNYRGTANGGFASDDGGGDDDGGYRSAAVAGSVGRNGNRYGGPGGGQGDGAGTGYNPYAALPQQPGSTGSGGGGIGGPTGNAPSGAGPALAAPGGAVGGGGVVGGTGGGMGSGSGGGAANGYVGGGNGAGTPPTGAGSPNSAVRGGGANGQSANNPYVTMPQGLQTAPAGGNSAGSPGTAPRAGGSRSNGPAMERPEGYVVGQPPREARASATANSRSADGLQGQVLRPGEWEPTPDMPRTPPDKKDYKPPRSLAERRGEDWGLRDAGRGSVGVTRPIRIECYADRLVVISDRSPGDNRVISLGPHTVSSIDALISAVWGHIEGWGIAGRGMYWRPVLQVSVAAGAEERFADLAALLDGSGLAVKRR